MSILYLEDTPFGVLAGVFHNEILMDVWFEEELLASLPIEGRIKTIDQKLAAAFVEVGDEKPGFLPLKNLTKVHQGQKVFVKIKRQAVEGKGAVLQLVENHEGQPAGEPIRALLAQLLEVCAGEKVVEIVVNGARIAPPLKAVLEEKQQATPISSDPASIANYATSLWPQVEEALSRVVQLDGGARLIIDELEALSAIDIDVGKAQGQSKRGTTIKACLDTIEPILQQIRLRRIAGQVVIDFPALAVKSSGDVFIRLKKSVAVSKVGCLLRIDEYGLATLILPKKRASLLQLMTQEGQDAPLSGRVYADRFIAEKAWRALQLALEENRAAKFELCASPDVIAFIDRKSTLKEQFTEKYGARFMLSTNAEMKMGEFDVKEC